MINHGTIVDITMIKPPSSTFATTITDAIDLSKWFRAANNGATKLGVSTTNSSEMDSTEFKNPKALHALTDSIIIIYVVKLLPPVIRNEVERFGVNVSGARRHELKGSTRHASRRGGYGWANVSRLANDGRTNRQAKLYHDQWKAHQFPAETRP